ncbi:MAG: TPM domain-containing protein, partial [Candidatus Eremiobacteraeota bacterium]|nr:TPM domain-containing protein [Candidatus Eremiobacteraeota bacterium]
MKPLAALAALTVVATAAAPAWAFSRSSYVVDDAHLLSASAISQIDNSVGAFNQQTGKEVLVVTVPSLDGQTPDAAIERSFAQQQVNGVEIFIAKDEHEIRIAGDRASSRFFPNGSYQAIARSMRASFRAGDYDGGVTNGVNIILNTYRGHASSLGAPRAPVQSGTGVTRSSDSSGGFSMGWLWWIVILAVIFFVIRGIFRAMAGPRMMPPGYGGPGYGGPGYGGPGWGYGGGGGGFWSGLLGGLGGAFLGNELFGNRGGG